MATAATAPTTDPFETWISSLPSDARYVLVERVLPDSGIRGGRRKRLGRVDIAALRATARGLRNGRYRLTAYGPQGAARGGVCAVDVASGIVSLAARPASGRPAPRAPKAPIPRRSDTDAALAARVAASEAEITKLRLELAEVREHHGAEIGRLTREVRRWKRAAKGAPPQPPSAPSTRPSASAMQAYASAPASGRFDFGRIVAPRYTHLAPNPARPAPPTQRTPATPDASRVMDFLRGTNSSAPRYSPWPDLTPVIRYLRRESLIQRAATLSVRSIAPTASTRSGVLRAYVPSVPRASANETEWAAGAASALFPATGEATRPSAPAASAASAPVRESIAEHGDETPESESVGAAHETPKDVETRVDATAPLDGAESTTSALSEDHGEDHDAAGAIDPPMPLPPPWVDRSPSNEFVPAPEFLVPRSLGRRLERLARSVTPSPMGSAAERVYAEALTFGLESLAAELEIVRPANNPGPTVAPVTRRPAARSFTRLRRMHVPARLVHALRVVAAAGVADTKRFPNAVAVHAEALRRGVEILEQHPAQIETEQDHDPSRRRPINVAEAIGAQKRGGSQCDA